MNYKQPTLQHEALVFFIKKTNLNLENYSIYIAMILGGALAGFINTLAGSGSLITLSIFMNIGHLPADIANATNRIGVLLQSLTAATTFAQNGKIKKNSLLRFVLPMVVGAILGAALASQISAQNMEYAIGFVMFLMLIIIVLKPKKWLREQSQMPQKLAPLTIILLFAVGFYGGFVQAGVGVLMLAVFVLRCGLNLTESNALKLVLVFMLTLPALAIFMYQNQVHWVYGAVTAIGQVAGAQLAARFALKSKTAARWTRRLLILVVLISIFKLFFGTWFMSFITKYA